MGLRNDENTALIVASNEDPNEFIMLLFQSDNKRRSWERDKERMRKREE